jgi:hypothetical protein
MTIDDLPQVRQASMAQIETLAALLQQPSRVDGHPPWVDYYPPRLMPAWC